MSEKEPNIEETVIEALLETWGRFPQMRLGQLIMNVVLPEKPCPEIFYVEDSEIIKKSRAYSNSITPKVLD